MKRTNPKVKAKKQTAKASGKSPKVKRAAKAVKPNRETSKKSKRAAPRSKKVKAPQPMRRKPTAEEIAYQNMLVQFEAAVKLASENHFAKARGTFEKLVGAAPPDLAQKALMYLNVCNQRLSRPDVQLKSAEDHYNYAVQLANEGMFEDAEEYLRKALKLSPQLDYVHYALASTSALRESAEEAMEHLAHAIELNPRNRYLAQNDPDFSNLGEDPRFTEMLYPEKPV